MRQTTKKTWANIILSILFMLPLYWAAATSLKGKGEIYQVPPTLVPHIPSLENYVKIFTLENGIYLRYFMNSVMITICSILCTAVVSIAAGYGPVSYTHLGCQAQGCQVQGRTRACRRWNLGMYPLPMRRRSYLAMSALQSALIP